MEFDSSYEPVSYDLSVTGESSTATTGPLDTSAGNPSVAMDSSVMRADQEIGPSLAENPDIVQLEGNNDEVTALSQDFSANSQGSNVDRNRDTEAEAHDDLLNGGQATTAKLVADKDKVDLPSNVEGELEFNGNNGKTIANSPQINTQKHDERSIVLKFKADETQSRQVLYEEGGKKRGINIYLDKGKLQVGGWNRPKKESGWQGTFLSTTSNQIREDEWHHVTLTLNGGDSKKVQPNGFKAYLDGELLGEGKGSQLWAHGDAIGVGQASGTTRFRNGGSQKGTDYSFTGSIDDLQLYNRELSGDEVAQLAGELTEEPAKTVRITDFGADPSGQNDSTKAIRDAIEAAGINGKVIFPEGTYVVGTNGVGGSLFDPYDGMTFEGESGAIMKNGKSHPEGSEITPFNLGLGDDRIYQDIVFRGLRFEDFDVAVRLTDTKDITIEDNYFFNSSIVVFSDIENDEYGNSGTKIVDNVIEIPDYRDPQNNPDYDPNRETPYSNEELDALNYWIQFPIRIMSWPWDDSINTSVWNRDLLVQGNQISGGAYNAIEMAGHQVENVQVLDNEFRDNYGVAIDFDKGVKNSVARGNSIYNMMPTEQHGAGEMHAIGVQRGGEGSQWDYIPTTGINIEDNNFYQDSRPYDKINVQGGYDIEIEDNVIQSDDAGGNALTLSFTDQIVGSVEDSFEIEGNDFLRGDVVVAGDIWGEPEIVSPIIFDDNQINGTLRIMNHTYSDVRLTDNKFRLSKSEGFVVTQGNQTTIKQLTKQNNDFGLGELDVRPE